MESVSISHLRQHLPEYIALVAGGKSVQVTVRGRAVAEIVPAGQPADDAAAARERLRGSVQRFDAPFEPVLAADEWDMNR